MGCGSSRWFHLLHGSTRFSLSSMSNLPSWHQSCLPRCCQSFLGRPSLTSCAWFAFSTIISKVNVSAFSNPIRTLSSTTGWLNQRLDFLSNSGRFWFIMLCCSMKSGPRPDGIVAICSWLHHYRLLHTRTGLQGPRGAERSWPYPNRAGFHCAALFCWKVAKFFCTTNFQKRGIPLSSGLFLGIFFIQPSTFSFSSGKWKFTFISQVWISALLSLVFCNCAFLYARSEKP